MGDKIGITWLNCFVVYFKTIENKISKLQTLLMQWKVANISTNTLNNTMDCT